MACKETLDLIVQLIALSDVQAKMAKDDLELQVDWPALGQQARDAAKAERIDLTELETG